MTERMAVSPRFPGERPEPAHEAAGIEDRAERERRPVGPAVLRAAAPCLRLAGGRAGGRSRRMIRIVSGTREAGNFTSASTTMRADQLRPPFSVFAMLALGEISSTGTSLSTRPGPGFGPARRQRHRHGAAGAREACTGQTRSDLPEERPRPARRPADGWNGPDPLRGDLPGFRPHNQNMTVAARRHADRKTSGHRS